MSKITNDGLTRSDTDT